jgi:hypothetical protein
MTLSCLGLFASIYVHVGALMGHQDVPEAFFWILHVGIFVVFIPAILMATQLLGNTRRPDFWKLILKDSPEWMRYLVFGFFGYALVNFALFIFNSPSGGSGTNPPPTVWRGFSGHWMAFYSASFAMLYSEANWNSKEFRCINGHVVQPGANFCEQCGSPVLHIE